MSSKKFLSKKKESLSISISRDINEWIGRYVSKNHRLNPNDIRFKNKSKFCSYLLEKCMEILTSGKSLDEIDSIPDKKVVDLYENLSFKAVIPFFNIGILNNKYSDENIKFSPSMFLRFREWILDDLSFNNFENMKKFLNRVKKFLLSNKLTKDLKIDFFKEKGGKYFNAILEYIGIYKNLHYENCKAMAGIFGYLGFKLESFMFSENDLYTRFDFKETDLFTSKEFAKKKRMELLEQNLKYLINYYNIINDEDHYLWMNLAKDKGVFINFPDDKIFKKWLNIIENDFRKFGVKEEFFLYLLKFFEKIHWIKIEDNDQLAFKLNDFSKINEGSKEEILMMQIIRQYTHVSKENNIYYLEK
ncbi:MAG: hypothetical protein ACFFAO_17580 [Candidatus Hermodarchaeota archaeon]